MNLLELLGLCSMLFVAWFTWRQYQAADDGSGQSKRASLVEAWVNIVIGFSINFVANLVLIPLMAQGGHLSMSANWWGGWVFTTVSILRQYAIRRWFNERINLFARRVAGTEE